MEFRHLGGSGLSVSEISYGNWITHGSQVEEEQAQACVRAALDAGITTFDTADVYANTRAESVLAFADLVRAGKVLYLGVSEWNAEQISRGAALARELRIPLISNQPQYSMLWRVIESQVIP